MRASSRQSKTFAYSVLGDKYKELLGIGESFEPYKKLDSDGIIDWIEKYRIFDGNKVQSFTHVPFWVDILNDPHYDISCKCGRQVYKSTNAANILGYYSTVFPNSESSYVVDDEERKSTFSEKRLRDDTFLSNESLANFMPHRQANINRIRLVNGSKIYIMTDNRNYNHVEGKSNVVLVADEIQKQDSQYFDVALETLTATKGRVYRFGIGGESGSTWYRHWHLTDQKYWRYDDTTNYTDEKTDRVWKNQGWRNKLTFDGTGKITNTNQQLQKILKGQWVSLFPENTLYRGYSIPQEIFATIPLTIHDAETKYKIHPRYSIEFKEKTQPQSIFIPHCKGDFYRSSRRPITPEMVISCYDETLELLTGMQVKEIKNKYRNKIRIYLGIDWGKGPGKTVGIVLIHWRDMDRFQIAHVDSRPEEDTTVSARVFVETFRDFECDYCIADWGYGQSAVPLMQNGGTDIQGNDVQGLGRSKMMGCWTIGSRIEEDLVLNKEQDKEGVKQKDHIVINKTDAIQQFIDFVGQKVSVNDTFVTKLIIPMKKQYQCDFLLNDFCDITRLDIDQNDDSVYNMEDHRQIAEKKFNHPPDSVMSLIYAIECSKLYNEDSFKLFAVKKTGIGFRYKTHTRFRR